MARIAVWCAVVLLVALGVAAAIARALFVDDLAARLEPSRRSILRSLAISDPLPLQRDEELARFDASYAAHRRMTLLHVLPGALFLALAPLQFSRRIRSRRIRLHRWSGRLLLVAAACSTLGAFYFGLRMPFGGWPEATAIALFGGLFLVALAQAFLAVRRGDVARHREWMIRAFAVAIGISSVRLVGGILDPILTLAAVRPANVFVASLWIGWPLTVVAAETWIRHTRGASAPRATQPPPARLGKAA